MAFNCRCTKRRTCGKHVTLARHPDDYKVYPKCPMKGCKGHLNYAPYSNDMTQRRTCYCDGIRFPHKRGAFLNVNEICHHAEVEDLGDGPIKVVHLQPKEDCPF
jgi:hypothetical protein